jgi:hypothetical protein
MNSLTAFCVNYFKEINWLLLLLSVIIVFFVGAFWYGFLFPKSWTRVFKVDTQNKPSIGNMIVTMFSQLVAGTLLGLFIFVTVKISLWLAIFGIIAFAGWDKATLKFRFAKWNEYFMAALIDATYFAIAGAIFIIFGLM